MIRVLEAVPNFSEGRDLEKIESLVACISSFDVELLDWSADPYHNRSVVTFMGPPEAVEAASVEAAAYACTHFDLNQHRGVHPRVGALDVLPFVPLHGLSMGDAVASAHRVGARISELGVPVYFYGQASDPVGRSLADIRRGGFEALRDGRSKAGPPDLPVGVTGPHATAGVTCVGARPVLLAWNVFVEGIEVDDARAIAASIRERGGGFPGLRALGLQLGGGGRIQISMNLEDPEAVVPLTVYERIEAEVHQRGGRIVETEVIGMIPDTLVQPISAGRLQLPDPGEARVLSHRLSEYLTARELGATPTADLTE